MLSWGLIMPNEHLPCWHPVVWRACPRWHQGECAHPRHRSATHLLHRRWQKSVYLQGGQANNKLDTAGRHDERGRKKAEGKEAQKEGLSHFIWVSTGAKTIFWSYWGCLSYHLSASNLQNIALWKPRAQSGHYLWAVRNVRHAGGSWGKVLQVVFCSGASLSLLVFQEMNTCDRKSRRTMVFEA